VDLSYPGLPESWTGQHVHVARFEGPVAVIGDIHGRADLLGRLLDQLGDIPIIVAGDVGDRGPFTADAVDLLVRRGAIGVAGNHDIWLMTWAAGEGLDPAATSPMMGGVETLLSYGVTPTQPGTGGSIVPFEHRRWLLGLHVAIDLEVCGERYYVVHAGVPSTEGLVGLELEEVVPFLARSKASTLMWSWTDPETMLPVDRTVIMGHSPRPEPLDTGEVLAIDTGCGTVEGGQLTAVVLPERRFVTVG